ncbi:Peptidase M16 inactive domain family protein [Acanthocheilonema viteae]
MVLAAAGGIDHQKLVELGKQYFGDLGGADENFVAESGKFVASYQDIRDERMSMVFGALAVEGASWTHPYNIPLMVANTLIGQWDRTNAVGINAPSRLGQSLGLNARVQSFQAFNTCYKDTGLVGVYFVCEQSGARAVVDSITQQWIDLCDNITEEEVERGKRSLLTNMSLMLDGSTPICEDIGRQLLCYGRRIPMHELEVRINAVTAKTVKEVSLRIFRNKPIAFTVVGRTHDWPSSDYIENRLK